MKLYTYIVMLAIATGVASCNNSTEPATETTTPDAPAAAEPAAPVRSQTGNSTPVQDNDKTELGIDDKGIIVTKRKDGNETDIQVSKDSGKFRINRKR